MEYSKPIYILFAGANGVGKSTLFNLHSEYRKLPRINTDEIVKSLGDWKDTANQVDAGKQAVKLIRSYLDGKQSFSQETTLCGRGIIRNIRKAAEYGYCIQVHYVGVESAEICKNRIKHRVSVGGHGVPDRIVEHRFSESVIAMKKILPYCDKVFFYDNTEAFSLIAISENGNMDICCSEVPQCFTRFIDNC